MAEFLATVKVGAHLKDVLFRAMALTNVSGLLTVTVAVSNKFYIRLWTYIR